MRKAFSSRAYILNAQGYCEGAIADYTVAIRLCPTEALNYANRGHALTPTGSSTRPSLISTLTRSTSTQPPAKPISSAATRAAKKEFNKAIADYTDALRLDPRAWRRFT